jgi:hypothetical protein
MFIKKIKANANFICSIKIAPLHLMAKKMPDIKTVIVE